MAEEKEEKKRPVSLYQEIAADFRFAESLKGCLQCGTCAAVCPAAQFYDYSPRQVAEVLLKADEDRIRTLMEEAIWWCAQCYSCKYRCPKENSVADLVMAMREIAVDQGMAQKALEGYARIMKMIVMRGNQLAPDMISSTMHPDWGPRIAQMEENQQKWRDALFEAWPGMNTVDRSWDIPDFTIYELQRIWQMTGCLERLRKVWPFLAEDVEENLEDQEEEMEEIIESKRARRKRNAGNA